MRTLTAMIIMVLIASVGISQPSSDSTKLPNSQLIAAMKAIDSGRIAKKEVSLLRGKMLTYDSLVHSKDSTIRLFARDTADYRKIIKSYIASDKNNHEQIQLYYNLATKTSQELRRQKWATRIVFVLGFGAAGYLAFK